MRTLLELSDISLGYDREIYRNITASVRDSEMIALLGSNGAGKSTLLKSIAGIQKCMSGYIIIAGKEIKDYRRRKLAELVAYVPANSPRPDHLSLFDMIAGSLYNQSNWIGSISKEQKKFIGKIIEKVGLNNFEDRECSTLSDGEFQRAVIARSLVQDTPLILLDEPTAFLDIPNKIAVIRMLKKIVAEEKKTVIFSTHDIQNSIKACDKLWIMGYDQFMEGKPERLIEERAFERMFKDSSLTFDSQLHTFT